MKRFAPSLALIAFGLACTDATSPDQDAGLKLMDPTVGTVLGEKPPPPVDAVIEITISSPGSAIFTGVYFSNGKISDDGLIAEPTLDGTAWLRLDNKQPTPDLGDASPNTRFMVKGDDTACPVDPSVCATGMGTLYFREFVVGQGYVVVTYKIVRVDRFIRFNRCGAPIEGVPPSPCASITFRAEVVGGPPCSPENPSGCHIGHAEAFDRASCLVSNSDGFSIDPSCVPSSGEG